MVSCYLASKFERRAELQRYARQLQSDGCYSTSRWLTSFEDNHRKNGMAYLAAADLADVAAADVFVVFTLQEKVRGGMHVELGYALALKKKIVVIGPRVTIFHHLPNVRVFAHWKDAREYLKEL